MCFMCRFNSFSPGQKAIHVGITRGFMKAPGFRPSPWSDQLSVLAVLDIVFCCERHCFQHFLDISLWPWRSLWPCPSSGISIPNALRPASGYCGRPCPRRCFAAAAPTPALAAFWPGTWRRTSRWRSPPQHCFISHHKVVQLLTQLHAHHEVVQLLKPVVWCLHCVSLSLNISLSLYWWGERNKCQDSLEFLCVKMQFLCVME